MKKQPYSKPKIRVLCGPNAAGKSSIYPALKPRYNMGIYINADDIEKQLATSKYIDLGVYGIEDINTFIVNDLLKTHTIIKKAQRDGYDINLLYEDNKFRLRYLNNQPNSYEAAFIADVLREELLKRRKKFTFETVMSHPSKIDFLKKAIDKGYKNYLYYVATESYTINIDRVKRRVLDKGHPVKESKIKSRYKKSLSNLKEAIKYSYRAFLFDSSDIAPRLILDVFEGQDITYHHSEIPNWVTEYLLKK